jgi:hypothetical protein
METADRTGHFLGAVVLKLRETPAGTVSKRSIIDGQQRLTTLQLLLDAAQLVLLGVRHLPSRADPCITRRGPIEIPASA